MPSACCTLSPSYDKWRSNCARARYWRRSRAQELREVQGCYNHREADHLGRSAQSAVAPKQLENEDEEQALILCDHWQTKVRVREHKTSESKPETVAKNLVCEKQLVVPSLGRVFRWNDLMFKIGGERATSRKKKQDDERGGTQQNMQNAKGTGMRMTRPHGMGCRRLKWRLKYPQSTRVWKQKPETRRGTKGECVAQWLWEEERGQAAALEKKRTRVPKDLNISAKKRYCQKSDNSRQSNE